MTEKIKQGLNSTNQQLYNISTLLTFKEGDEISESDEMISQPQITDNDDNSEPQYTRDDIEDDPFDDEDSEKTDEEVDELPLSERDELKILEDRRRALKKDASQKTQLKKLEDEKIKTVIANDNRIEARAKLKAEEILIKKEIQEGKGKARHVPDEIRKECEDKYGRF